MEIEFEKLEDNVNEKNRKRQREAEKQGDRDREKESEWLRDRLRDNQTIQDLLILLVKILLVLISQSNPKLSIMLVWIAIEPSIKHHFVK